MAKKALENDGQAVTSDNVRRLDRAQQRNGSAEREKKNSAGSGGRRRNTSRAALASVGHTASLSSSSEEGKPRVSSRQRRPTSGGSRGSVRSRLSKVGSVNLIHGSIDAALLESNTNSSTSVSQFEFDYDHAAERTRVREFFDAHGYMPAPLQSPGSIRRRLRVIRRLGLENPESYHRKTLDRFTRLAINIFKTKMAIVSIVGKDRQTFVSEIGLNKDWTDLDVAFCSHTIMGSGEQCMIVPDANRDWRFKKNPFVGEGSGPIQFYAGVPLVVGSGHNTAIIGSLCVIDDKPREFSKDNQSLLRDLAESAVREVSA